MKQTYIETIRKACIEANPSILDLKFGCQFLWNEKNKGKKYAAVFENWVSKNESVRCMSRPFFQQVVVTRERIVEIIGRDIRLADVLFVFLKIASDYNDKYNTSAEIVRYIRDIQPEIVGRWNLLKDNLEDQSEDTLKFIAGLLTNK